MAHRRSMSCTEICKQNEPTGAGNDIRIAVTSLKSAGLSRPQQNVALIGGALQPGLGAGDTARLTSVGQRSVFRV